MAQINLKYEYIVDRMVESVLQESFITRIKDFFVFVYNKIKTILILAYKKISTAEFEEEGTIRITVPIPETLSEMTMTKSKIASASKLKGSLYEVATVLAIKEQIKRTKSNVSKRTYDILKSQLQISIGNKVGKVIKEVERAAKVAAKLIVVPIKEAGGTIIEINTTGEYGQKSGGIDKFDLLVKWKKVGLSKQQLDKISLKLYSGKVVTVANKSIDTFFKDFFSNKHAKEVNNLIDNDKKIKKMQDEESELNLKVKQLRRKFKKSEKVEKLNEKRRELRADLHPLILSIVFKYIQNLLDNKTTRNIFIKRFFEYSGLGNDAESRMVYVLNTGKGRMQGMIEEPDIDLSKIKLVYTGGSTFQIKNSRNNKTMVQFGMKTGGHKLNIDVNFSSAEFKRF